MIDVIGYADAFLAATEANLAYKEAGKKALAAQLMMTRHGPYIAKPKPPTKCPSCGSREFRLHAGRSVCSYCRSES